MYSETRRVWVKCIVKQVESDLISIVNKKSLSSFGVEEKSRLFFDLEQEWFFLLLEGKSLLFSKWRTIKFLFYKKSLKMHGFISEVN